MAVLVAVLAVPLVAAPGVVWRSLPDMPGGVGFAGMYAGSSHGVLLAGGGANFPPAPAGAEPGKVWHEDVYLLRVGADAWEPAGRLPLRGAYGVCATWNDRVVCVGGNNTQGAFGEAWTMEWTSAGLKIDPLPPVPVAAEMAVGAVSGDTLYLAVDGPADSAPIRLFTLELSASPARRRWVEQPGLSGVPPRKLAVGTVADGRFYLFGGLSPGPGSASRHLRDAYAFSPAEGWRRLADLPRGNAGAPGPALRWPGGKLAVWGGLDAPWVELSRSMERFESGFLVYDPARDAWSEVRQDPEDPDRIPSRLTAPVVGWQGGYAVIGGETAPRVRTTTTPWISFR